MTNIFAVNIDKDSKIHKSKYIEEGNCIFPFKYNKKEYSECVEGKRGHWCPTKLKENKTYDTFAYCPKTQDQINRVELLNKVKGNKTVVLKKKKKENKVQEVKTRKSSNSSQSPKKVQEVKTKKSLSKSPSKSPSKLPESDILYNNLKEHLSLLKREDRSKQSKKILVKYLQDKNPGFNVNDYKDLIVTWGRKINKELKTLEQTNIPRPTLNIKKKPGKKVESPKYGTHSPYFKPTSSYESPKSPKYSNMSPYFKPTSSYESPKSTSKSSSLSYGNVSPEYLNISSNSSKKSPHYKSPKKIFKPKKYSPKYVPTSPPYVPTSPGIKKPIVETYDVSEYIKMGLYKTSPKAFGWVFDNHYGSGDEDVYRSLILDKNGKPTDAWWVEDNDYTIPNEYVQGWNDKDLYYEDGTKIPTIAIIKLLYKNNTPNNWNKCIKILKEQTINGQPIILRAHEIPDRPRPKYKLNIVPLYNDDAEVSDIVMVREGINKNINGKIKSFERGKGNNIKVFIDSIDDNEDSHDSSNTREFKKNKKITNLEINADNLIKIEPITVDNYWKQRSNDMKNSFQITDSENRYFNSRYSIINNQYNNDNEIYVDSHIRAPVYEYEELNPIYKCNRDAYIKRSSINIYNGKRTRLWYIFSKNEGRNSLFYFTYTENIHSIHPPLTDWYGLNGRNILVKGIINQKKVIINNYDERGYESSDLMLFFPFGKDIKEIYKNYTLSSIRISPYRFVYIEKPKQTQFCSDNKTKKNCYQRQSQNNFENKTVKSKDSSKLNLAQLELLRKKKGK
jgi:hypothetical protein